MENNSEIAVKWAREPSTTPWTYITTMMHMEFFKSQLKNWNFLKIRRLVNKVVDSLAKAEVEREDEFLWVIIEDGEDGPILLKD